MAPRTLKFVSLSAAALALLFSTEFVRAAAAGEAGTCAADDDACISQSGKNKESVMLQTRRPGKMQLSKDSPAELEQVGAKETVEIKVASYNMFWWNVQMYNRFDGVFNRIRDNGPYHLIGFQENEDVARTLSATGLIGEFDYFQGNMKNPAPLAWNKTAFEKLSEPKARHIGVDQWGDRWVNSVKLNHKATNSTVLFLNTHGPLQQCGTQTLEANWKDSVVAEKVGVDQVFMTGDFNCQIFETAMLGVKSELPRSVDFYIDHILSTANVMTGERLAGEPSDHPFVRGTFSFEVEKKEKKEKKEEEEALVQTAK